ncbi:MAG: AAA family ATPase [Rhizobiales bacterium]|nr:AAA family ATPase [Hyphomicrobiales bacterium]MBO6698062.1 AAA family ATPase [Hyphomicrobiales bacterium]MBO6735684.1 AAA family ATPase [Hyphomicrobiales bacterium]MBO6910508.1 AAA family ATPase [Hyphomicrobiales bacterium]MBO6956141.1 AAA family ATPase [Hyphomicrobiales bacterium]
MARKAVTKEPESSAGLPLNAPLVGHSGPQAAFIDAFSAGRMHHGWLLHGPKGVGKARFAAQAAAYLIAEQARQGTETLAVNVTHPDARLVTQGAHPDLHWIDRKTGSDGRKLPKTIPVGAVRSTLQKLQSTAAYGGCRVLVIDAVDELNVEGANALLKPLEEPSHQTVLLLVAHALNQVLPTIRSRCRHLAFGPLDGSDLQSVARALSETDISETLVELSDGRAGHMLTLARDPEAMAAYQSFCALAADAGGRPESRTLSERLMLAGTLGAMAPESRDLLLGLIEDWLSRRLRGKAEPPGLPTPPSLSDLRAKKALADLWSEHTAAVRTHVAINLNISERIMVLFDRLDQVYSHG